MYNRENNIRGSEARVRWKNSFNNTRATFCSILYFTYVIIRLDCNPRDPICSLSTSTGVDHTDGEPRHLPSINMNDKFRSHPPLPLPPPRQCITIISHDRCFHDAHSPCQSAALSEPPSWRIRINATLSDPPRFTIAVLMIAISARIRRRDYDDCPIRPLLPRASRRRTRFPGGGGGGGGGRFSARRVLAIHTANVCRRNRKRTGQTRGDVLRARVRISSPSDNGAIPPV